MFIISASADTTHSHDPLHRLQLQGVFVTVQHLLQVVMSEEGNTAKHSYYRGLKLEIENLSKSASVTQKWFFLKLEM